MYLIPLKHQLCSTRRYSSTLCFIQDDFAHNREFITMVVYKTDGKKVYYPGQCTLIVKKMMLEINKELQMIFWKGTVCFKLRCCTLRGQSSKVVQSFSLVWPPSTVYTEGINQAVHVGSMLRGLHHPADAYFGTAFSLLFCYLAVAVVNAQSEWMLSFCLSDSIIISHICEIS